MITLYTSYLSSNSDSSIDSTYETLLNANIFQLKDNKNVTINKKLNPQNKATKVFVSTRHSLSD